MNTYLELLEFEILDDDISMDSSMDGLSSTESIGSVDTVDMILEHAIEHADMIYSPLVDPTINFKKPPLLIRDINESDSLLEFRFRQHHLQEMADRLWYKLGPLLNGTHDKINIRNRYVVPYETGFLMVLYRLARPRRLRPDMERYFSIHMSKISTVLSVFVDAMYEVALPYLSDPSIFQHRFRLYADLINEKSGGAIDKVWGFIDGTVRRTCRPMRFQKANYSGHKRTHGIKFQSVVTPDGLIALLYGPVAGSRHDAYLLRQSRLIPQLAALMPLDTTPPAQRFMLYGDPAYPTTHVLFGGVNHPEAGTIEAKWNRQMSKVREVVEWLFKEVIVQWSFLDFRASMKIFQFPVAKYYIIGAFLGNIRTCYYGSQTAAYFGCLDEDAGKLTIDQYLSLVD